MDLGSYSRHDVCILGQDPNAQWRASSGMASGPSVGRLFSAAWCHVSLVEAPVGSLALVLFARSFSPTGLPAALGVCHCSRENARAQNSEV